MNEIQKLQLELMRHASFNAFDGDNVSQDLEANQELWRCVVMTRLGDLIYLRDIGDGIWNVDTLFIIPVDGRADELEKLALRNWAADDVNWLEDDQSRVMLLGQSPAPKILKVWAFDIEKSVRS